MLVDKKALGYWEVRRLKKADRNSRRRRMNEGGRAKKKRGDSVIEAHWVTES